MSSTTTAVRPGAPATDRVVRPRRPLPNGRAVVGALLVVLAAVGTFAAYLDASAPPTTTWLVASEALRPGQVLREGDVAVLDRVAIELPDAQAAATYGPDAAGGLVGAVVLAPVQPGDLLLRSAAARTPAQEPGVSLSFSVAPERAFGGRLGAGERVDVLATVERRTGVVARDVQVAEVVGGGSGLGGTALVVTLLVPDLAVAQEVLHAADTGALALVRGGDPAEPTSPVTAAEDLLVPASGGQR